jgi:hypothetical protein
MGGALCVAEADGVGHRVRHAQHLQPAVRLRGQQQPRQILGAEARTHAPRAQLEQRLDVARLGPYLRHEPGAPEQSLLAACYLYLIPLCSLVWKLLRRRRVTA